MASNKSQHTLELVQDLLDDLELGRSLGEQVILTASRLAELLVMKVNNGLSLSWVVILGRMKYPLNMGITGRWTKKDENKGYWIPLAQIDAMIEAEKSKLAVMRIPDSAGDHNYAAQAATRAMNDASNNISKFSGIRSKGNSSSSFICD